MNALRFSFSIQIIVLFILLTGCQYDIDEIYEDTSKSLPLPPNITILELSLERDSFLLSEPLIIKFKLDADPNIIRQTTVTLDHTKYASFNSGSGEFILYPYNLVVGEHKFHLEVITSTNSGSIADVLEAEAFAMVSNDWVFFNMGSGDLPVLHYSQYNENGDLSISWPPCSFNNIEYRISKFLGNKSGPLLSSTITQTFEFSDPDYIGEAAFYKISVINKRDLTEYPWYSFSIEKDIPVPYLDLINNSYVLRWKRKEYFQKLSGMIIHDLETGKDLDNLSFTETVWDSGILRFAEHRKLALINVPVSISEIYTENRFEYSNTFEGTIGTKFADIKQDGMFAITNESRLIFQKKYSNVLAYDLVSDRIVDSLYSGPRVQSNSFKLFMSPSRKEFCLFESQHDEMYCGESNDLSGKDTYSIDLSNAETTAHIIDESDEIIIQDDKNFYFFKKSEAAIADTTTFSESGFPTVRDLGNHCFSSDGRYYFHTADNDLYVYEFDGRNFKLLYTINEAFSSYSDRFLFDNTIPSRIIHFDGESVYFRNSEDFSVISSYPFTMNIDYRLMYIDLVSKRFLILDIGLSKINIYDLIDGTLLFSLPAAMDGSYILSGNTIIAKAGLRFDLP